MQIKLTSAAIKKIQDELELLEKTERPKISERIKTARAFGDLSENYEYHAAKEEQGLVEARIRELRAVLNRAQVVEGNGNSDGAVGLGSIVKVFDRKLEEEIEYTITTMIDANPLEDKISDQSPIGKALEGKKPGDVVEVETPAGIHSLEVLEVRQSEV